MTIQLPNHPESIFGYVDWIAGISVGDFEDEDRLPDLRAAFGVTVTFTPATVLKKTEIAPVMTILKTPIAAVVCEDGHLRQKGQEEGPAGLYLPVGRYNVTYAGATGLPKSHQIDVEATHTIEEPLDLTTATDYVAPPGSLVQVLHLPTTGAENGQTFGWNNGVLEWYTPPAGPQGEPGPPGPGALPSHETILLSAATTLPTDHPVLTVRATAPSTVSVGEAADGTVVTVHVAEGWQHITFAPEVVVTGETDTTETWVVLVRAEGVWQALVSGGGGERDTGSVNVTAEALAAAGPNPGLDDPSDLNWNQIIVRRIGARVDLYTRFLWGGSTPTNVQEIAHIPVGYRPEQREMARPDKTGTDPVLGNHYGRVLPADSMPPGLFSVHNSLITPYADITLRFSYLTADPWPTP